MIDTVPPYVIRHDDPHELARSAAVRSPREQDPLTRAHAREMSVAQRLHAGLVLSGLASHMRPRSRSATDLEPARILRALERHGVDYVAVGGVALIANDVIRATGAVELIPKPADTNRSQLAAAIQALAGAPHGEPETDVTAALLARDANMRFVTAAGQLDVLSAEPYRRLYPDLRARSILAEVDGAAVRIVSRNDLISLKAGSGRDRDLLDIGDLLALEE